MCIHTHALTQHNTSTDTFALFGHINYLLASLFFFACTRRFVFCIIYDCHMAIASVIIKISFMFLFNVPK